MAEPPIFKNGMAWRRDAQGCERIVWPSSESDVPDMTAQRQADRDIDGAVLRVQELLGGTAKKRQAPLASIRGGRDG